jgi:hypothetical protein
MMSFSQCASTAKLEDKAPLEFGDVYYKEWSNPARYTGSGLNLFIPITSNTGNIILDSIYFKDKQVKLEFVNDTLFVGRFETDKNKPLDIVMSSEPLAEYGNKAPKLSEKLPFELKGDECVISYKAGKKTKFFKISNIIKKQDKQTLYPASKPQ